MSEWISLWCVILSFSMLEQDTPSQSVSTTVFPDIIDWGKTSALSAGNTSCGVCGINLGREVESAVEHKLPGLYDMSCSTLPRLPPSAMTDWNLRGLGPKQTLPPSLSLWMPGILLQQQKVWPAWFPFGHWLKVFQDYLMPYIEFIRSLSVVSVRSWCRWSV